MHDDDATVDDDVVELLEAQHAEIRRLIDAVNAGRGGERRADFEALVRLLAVHETSEEEVVHPAVATFGDAAREAVEERKREEGEAKRVLADLESSGVEGEDFAGRFARFGRAVDDHATAEEVSIFPLLRSELDDDARRGMATLLVAAQAIAPTHAHRHAPESALGNLAVGPFVAVVDRVRDAIRDARR